MRSPRPPRNRRRLRPTAGVACGWMIATKIQPGFHAIAPTPSSHTAAAIRLAAPVPVPSTVGAGRWGRPNCRGNKPDAAGICFCMEQGHKATTSDWPPGKPLISAPPRDVARIIGKHAVAWPRFPLVSRNRAAENRSHEADPIRHHGPIASDGASRTFHLGRRRQGVWHPDTPYQITPYRIGTKQRCLILADILQA
jgi:hypothetical protein